MSLSLRPVHALAILAASFILGLPAQSQEAPAKVRPAKLIDIKAEEANLQVSLPTIVEADRSAVLTMQAGGVLQEFPVTEGTVVQKGDLIARVDTRTLENDLNQARAQVEVAENEFTRAETLIKQNTISQSVYDQRKSARDLAVLAVEAAEKRLSDASLYAPFDGVIALVDVKQFQTVSAQESIVTLQSNTLFEAVLQVPARAIADSSKVDVVDTYITLDVAPLVSIPTTFKSIAQQADAASQTYEARFTFEPPEGLVVLPGMTGEMFARLVQTNGAAPHTEITIPVSAVMSDGGQTFVWLVNVDTMAVSRQQVTLDDAIGSALPVLEGLSVGDTIVGAGASYLHDGMIVRRLGE